VCDRDFDVAPAFERRKHHEEDWRCHCARTRNRNGPDVPVSSGSAGGFRRAVALRSRPGHQRTIRIARAHVDGQHVLHGGYERGIGLRRNDPALSAVGLENVFLASFRSLSRPGTIDNLQFHDLFLQQPQVQTRRPLGGLEQARASVWLPSRRQKSRATPVSPAAAAQHQPRSLPPPVAFAPGNHMETLVSKALMIRLSAPACTGFRDIGPSTIFSPSAAVCAGLLPFRISASSRSRSSPLSRTTYFFTEISWQP